MSDVVIYLLEASALLMVLYGIYLLLLSKETFFTFNRYYLIAIFVLSLLIPLLNSELISAELDLFTQSVEELGDMRMSYHSALSEWSKGTNQGESANTNWYNNSQQLADLVFVILVSIYAFGLIINLCRMFWTLYKISNLKKSFSKSAIDNVRVVEVSHEIAPFSFMKDVFIHTGNLDDEEFTQILAHEKAHIEQKHSIDLLIVQILAAVLWFNPVAWWLIKSLKTTHEYIADKKMITQGYSLVEYQSLLLRQLISNNSFGLVHNFNLSFIKKRITMMKIKESGWTGRAKVAFALSSMVLFSLIIVQCNSSFEEVESTIEAVEPTVDELESPSEEVELSVVTRSSITFYLGEDQLDLRYPLSYSKMSKLENMGKFNYVIDGVSDDILNSPDSKMQITLGLGSEGKVLGQSNWEKVGKNKSIDIHNLFESNLTGDVFMIEIVGFPKGKGVPRFTVFRMRD